ncbi:unnamed protein product, partial [Prorocentrum cordatum]
VGLGLACPRPLAGAPPRPAARGRPSSARRGERPCRRGRARARRWPGRGGRSPGSPRWCCRRWRWPPRSRCSSARCCPSLLGGWWAALTSEDAGGRGGAYGATWTARCCWASCRCRSWATPSGSTGWACGLWLTCRTSTRGQRPSTSAWGSSSCACRRWITRSRRWRPSRAPACSSRIVGEVYVHCKAGHGRAAAVALAWMAYSRGLGGEADLARLNAELAERRRVRRTLHSAAPAPGSAADLGRAGGGGGGEL